MKNITEKYSVLQTFFIANLQNSHLGKLKFEFKDNNTKKGLWLSMRINKSEIKKIELKYFYDTRKSEITYV